jgi:hypothetical protein
LLTLFLADDAEPGHRAAPASAGAWLLLFLVYPVLLMLAGMLNSINVVTLLYILMALALPFIATSEGWVRAHVGICL